MKKLINPEDFSAVLNNYRGANAQVWLFNVSLKRLALRLSFATSTEVIYIVSISTDYISGPTSWTNSKLELIQEQEPSSTHDAIYKVVDEAAGFLLVSSGGIGLVSGQGDEIDTSFENFLGSDE